MSPSTRPSAAKLDGLQLMRGVAILLVVLFHAGGVFAADSYLPVDSWTKIFGFGHAGVELFFVISGFIICHAHWDEAGGAANARRFVYRRVTRIYPMVFIAATIGLAARYGFGQPVALSQIASSYLLLNFDFGFYPTVLWSLALEILFYAMFVSRYLSRRLFLWIICVWTAAAPAVFFLAFDKVAWLGPGSTLFFHWNSLFGIGVLLYLAWRRRLALSAGGRWALWVLATLLVAPSAVYDSYVVPDLPAETAGLYRHLLTFPYGIGAALAIYATLRTPILPRWTLVLIAIGNASFSIYLFHIFPIQIAVRILQKIGHAPFWLPTAATLALTALGIALGFAVWLWVERPMMRWFSRRPIAPGAAFAEAGKRAGA